MRKVVYREKVRGEGEREREVLVKFTELWVESSEFLFSKVKSSVPTVRCSHRQSLSFLSTG
jgi:hypothetical protein